MSKYEIIADAAHTHTVEKIVYRLLTGSKNRFDAPEDLIQDVYVCLLDKPEDLIVNLYNNGELGYYILRIVRNQMYSDHSPYFYTYIKFGVNSYDLGPASHIASED